MANNDNPNFDVLNAISILAKKLEKSKLKIRKTQQFISAEEKLNLYFNTTSRGTWVLCAMMSYYFENGGATCNFNNLADFFDCPVMSVIAYKKDVENLLSKKYIKNTKSISDEIELSNEFEISKALLQSVINNKKIIIKAEKKEDNSIQIIEKFVDAINNNEEVFDKIQQTAMLEEKYKKNDFLKKIIQIIPNDISARMFLYDCCYDLLQGNNESGLSSTLNRVYYSDSKFRVAENLMNDKHPLLQYDLISFVTKGNLSDSTVEITQKTKEMLFGEDAKLFTKSATGTDIIQPEKITQKELFYNAENEADIARLTDSLEDRNLNTIQERLKEKGLPKGIAVLLYGAPGTGKTETVYQIAKKTGRKILHVDISSSKSCWYGESEKIIKKIFVDYKNLCKVCKSEKNGKMPILLFNEADGILSKRNESTRGACDQTENAIQNIILEEMEKLEGIMIATTNLASNLDAAFERRFLFKIKFENPSVDAKMKIWKSKMEWLSDDAIRTFATDYDFSGGQIDNIVRKVTMDEVITGKRPMAEELIALCKNEKLGSDERKIGFF